MRYRRYARDAVVAIPLGDGVRSVVLCRPDGQVPLHMLDGTPQIVIEHRDFAAVAAIFECLALDLDQVECAKLGVEVDL